MKEGSVFEPLHERRECIDYDKELQENRSRRAITSCIALNERVANLEKRMSELEHIIEEYRKVRLKD